MTQTPSNGYLISALLTFSLLSALTITGSYLVDPFRLYHWTQNAQHKDGLDLFWYQRLHKAYRMESIGADKLVLGSSRAARLPPKLLGKSDSVYNASMPGATQYEILRMLEHGQAIQALQTVILGVDYSMFREGSSLYLAGFSDDRLRRVDPSPWQSMRHLRQQLTDLWNTLFSRSALAADITARKGLRQSKRSFSSDGTWVSLFSPEEKPRVYAMLARQKYTEFSRQSGELNFSLLDQILEFAARHDIKLIVLISPTHAHHMNVIRRAGAWPSYLDYQRRIVELASRYRGTGADVAVYGLEHQSDLVHEAPNSARDWFRDGIHFSRDTGSHIMACLFETPGEACDQRRRPMVLNPGNIESYLGDISVNMENYAQVRPKWYARLEQQLEKLQAKARAQ